MSWTWRKAAAPIIAQVIRDNEGKTEKEIRKALREAYPWGERAMHPYKVWCSEVNKQLKSIGIKSRGKVSRPPDQGQLF